MINKLVYTVIAASVTIGAYAQKSDGSTKSLINAEKNFAEQVAKEGAKSAFTSYSAADGLVFKPNPVNVKDYYATQSDTKTLTWSPVYAKVSKSGDWGFTTGPYKIDGDEVSYGQYLSVWKVVNGRWELALNLGTTHNKPLNKTKTTFIEPTSFHKPRFINAKEIAAGKDIIVTTEKTLNTTLKAYGAFAFAGFINPDVRVLFPGREPIIGKDKAMAFYNGMVKSMNLKTTKADRALGGDLAYTYGIATIDYKADLRESFNYVFIYECQPDHSWNIIMQIYTPAER